jgi:cellulose synthase/poly-beta-1,6-N-acetylglucosamine synthase-like glycosyltransferase
MGQPRISVLIAASGASAELQECLELVGAQAREVEAEVVLVLNTARAALPDECSRVFQRVGARLEFEENIGKSHALNRGVRACQGEVIAFTDDDALPRPGWLGSITAPLLDEGRPEKLVGSGGRVTPLYPTRGVPDWFVRLVESKSTSFLGPRHDMGPEPCDYGLENDSARSPIGANCAYRREVFQHYRFDPALGPNRSTGMRGGEDVALGRRLLADGYRLQYLPQQSRKLTISHVA